MASQKPEVPTPTPTSEALPVERGAGEGAAGGPAAGGAPTAKVVCREYSYRYNIKAPGRTKHYLIDATTWEVLRPTRTERSKTGAHGEDVYCLSEEVWGRVVVVALERSNSGKLRYKVIAPPGLEKYKEELEELLAKCGSFWEMEETIEMWAEAHHLGRGVSA
jgi:hypothetical protein